METRLSLENALHEAMRSRNETALRTIRLVMSSIKLAEIEKGQKLDEANILGIIQKEIKSKRETIVDAEKAGRADLIAEAKAEIAILEIYMPRQLSESELIDLIKEVIQSVGASTPQDTGKVMKVLMPRVQGRATGDLVSQAVRKLLAG